MYEGRTDIEPGRVLGHENMGRVVEVGSAVEQVKVGDMVVVPFNIACGHCQNCERGLTNYCLVANPDPQIAGAAYGFADMGPWNGGQAQYLLVPWADFNCLRLPEDAGPDELAKHGEVAFDYGLFWFKGQRMGTGQCPVKAYNRYLRDLVHVGRAKPSVLVSHELPLDQAPAGYQHFDARDQGWTKVVLAPTA